MAKRKTEHYNTAPATLVYPPGACQTHTDADADEPGIGMGAVDNTAGAGPNGSDFDPPKPDQTRQARGQGLPDDYRGWAHSATDNKGHDSKTNLRVQPAVARQMDIVVKSGRFPYRTSGELMRHAIYNHLEWLATVDQTIPSVMAQVDAINTLINDEQMLQEQSQVLQRLLATVERHLSMGDASSAHRLAETALVSIDTMPPGAWRDSYRQRFRAAFRYDAARTLTTPNLIAPRLQAPQPAQPALRTEYGNDNE